jgi:beta-aspartyl-peptidase (threonine type)
MKAIILFILCAGIFAPAAHAQQNGMTKASTRDDKLMREVRAVMDAQVEAWNRGDIDGFMRGYAQSPDTIFVSGDTVTRGWQTVLDRYKKGYDSREKMGQLTFSELEIMPFGKDAAVVIGRWQLKRANDTPHGRFTLIFRRSRAGWRIVHDHTS